MRGRKCAICIQARSKVTKRPGIDGVRRRSRSSISAAWGTPSHANGGAHDATLVDRVDHAHVGRLGDDQLGRPAQRLGQRQRAVGDLADRVQQSQTAGVGADRSRARAPATANAPEATIATMRIA